MALAPLADRARLRLGAAVHDTEVEAFAAAAGHDFNSMTPANALKWGSLLVGGKLGRYDFTQADALVDLAHAKGVQLRGHTLVWGRYAGHGHPADLEAALRAAPDPRKELERLMAQHIGAVLEHYRGRITQWDAVNEPLDLHEADWDDNVFYRTLGPEFVDTAFRLAHAADPTLELVLNEQLSSYDDEHAEKFFGIIQHLHDTGAPLHGVGLQSHLLTTIPSIASLKTFMRRIAELGLFIEITELDARISLFGADPYAAQGRFFQEVATACLEEPACRGITVWGISDRFSWLDTFPPFDTSRPNAPLLFDHDLRRKPAYLGFADALTHAPAARTTAPAPRTAAPAPRTAAPAAPAPHTAAPAAPAPRTASPVPATASPVPATASPVPATASPVPATASPVPATASPVPATASPAPHTAAPAPHTAAPQ